jgi:hypothetical protein
MCRFQAFAFTFNLYRSTPGQPQQLQHYAQQPQQQWQQGQQAPGGVHSLFPPGIRDEALPAIHVSSGDGYGGGDGGAGGGGGMMHVNPAYVATSYLNPHLPPDAAVVAEHPVVPPHGAEPGDWEWIEADKVWRSLEFPKTHRGTNPPGRHDVTLLQQWYSRALDGAHRPAGHAANGGGGDDVAAGLAARRGRAKSVASINANRGNRAAAAAAEKIAEEAADVESLTAPKTASAAAAAAAADSAARVEDFRKTASVHVQASHELIRQVMVHCYDRGALLAEVWAGYTAVLASILREERSARDEAREQSMELQSTLDAAMVRNAEWKAAFRAQGGQELVERIEQLREETVRVQHEVSTAALQHAAGVTSRAAFELKHGSLRQASDELEAAVAAISEQREQTMKRNSKSCHVSFAENVWEHSSCMQQGCRTNMVPFCHEHSRNCTIPGCSGWAELCRPHATVGALHVE